MSGAFFIVRACVISAGRYIKGTEITGPSKTISSASVDLDRDVFLRTLIRELSGTLEDVVGLDVASGFISIVGTAVGDRIGQSYRNALCVEKLSRSQVAEVLVDLKRRIEGQFFVIEENALCLATMRVPSATKFSVDPLCV